MGGRDEGGAVFITGASRGLGAALATAFAAGGRPVSICARSGDELEALADRIRSSGARCHATALDVTDEQAVEAWIRDGTERFGGVSALINNASMLGPRLPLESVPLREWRATIEANLTGTFIVSRAVLGEMRRRGGGSIVNVSSGAAIPPRVEWGPYAVSKLAVEGFSRNLAAELAGTGIRVNIVDPGAMRTGMRAEAYPDENPATLKEAESKVGVFLWLVGPESRHLSGERFHADRWRPG